LTGDVQDEERVPLGNINVAGGQDGGERNTEAFFARHSSPTAAAAAAAAAEERAAASNDAFSARHRPAHGAGAAGRDEGIRDDVQEEAEAVEAVQVAAVESVPCLHTEAVQVAAVQAAAKRRDADIHRALRVWAEEAGVWLLRLHPQPGQSVLPSRAHSTRAYRPIYHPPPSRLPLWSASIHTHTHTHMDVLAGTGIGLADRIHTRPRRPPRHCVRD
jgi:hypothetical protein